MSVIIRLQNLPWSANALDIRNYFRGLSIPEGGVHIVGGELGDAFIAFSTDEDARQAMMLDCGKIKEIQVKLLLSSRSEMHKVIEQARQTVPILTLTAPAPTPAPAAAPILPAPVTVTPAITPFSAALGNSMTGFGIPGIGNPNEIPQPAVIEPPAPMISPSDITLEDEDNRPERKRSKEKDRRRSRTRSRSRDRDRKDRKRDRRDRSRSPRERRRRDRSRSRDRRDRKRDRKDRSRSRDRSERSSPRRSHDRRSNNRKSPEKTINLVDDVPVAPPAPLFGNTNQNPNMQQIMNNAIATMQASAVPNSPEQQNRFSDPAIHDAYNKLNELGKKRNPNAFQGDQNGGNRFQGGRGGARGGAAFRRDGRTRFENEQHQDCCVAIRNAPNHTSYGDVRRFFPFLIDKHGIKMINDGMGRRTGNIYVRFCDPRSKQLALQRKNNELKGETVIVEALDDEAYENAVDSFLPFRDDNAQEEEIQPRVVPQPAGPICSVLRLTEMPNYVKEHDIIKIFSDFSLLSIMLNDCRLTRTKTAYVQFAKPEDARIAFERRNNYAFGKRLPVITPVTDEEYDKEKSIQSEKLDFPPIVEKEQPPMEPEGPRDPRQRRLEGAPQPPNQNQQSGVPFFQAPFVQQQQPFAGNFNSQFGGFPGNGGMDPRTAAANWANRPAFPNQMQPQIAPSGPDIEEDLDCVLMKGLPCDATDRTIVTFLSDTGAVPARIHLMLDPGGVPSGDCFCEFRSASEARRAASKHGHNLEGCRVTVDLVPRSVVEEALEGPKPPNDHRDMGPHNGPPHGNGPPQYYDGPRGAKRGGFRGRGFDRGGFDRGGFDRGSFDRGGSDRGGFDRGGYNRGGFDQGRGGFDQGRGGWIDRGRGFDRGRGRGGFDRGRGRGRGRGGFENGRDSRDVREDDDSALEDFGAPGCVLSLENVPFRATVDDILSYFGDFELTQDDVIRRYNERGQPTGDARVAFRTPFDAQRALSTRNLSMIHDRRVSLTLL